MAEPFEGAYGTVSIGASAAVIKAARSKRDSIVVQNVHATQTLYIGSDASVLTTTGLQLLAGASIRLNTKSVVYGIASGAATDVRYFEEF